MAEHLYNYKQINRTVYAAERVAGEQNEGQDIWNTAEQDDVV